MEFTVDIFQGSWSQLENISLESMSIFVGMEDGYSPRIRILPSGKLICYGESFELVKSLRDDKINFLPFRLVFDGEVLYSASLILRGQYDEASAQCELSIYTEDKYTKVLKEWSERVSIAPPPRGRLDPVWAYYVTLKTRIMVEFVTASGLNFQNADWSIFGGSQGALQAYDETTCYVASKEYDHGDGKAYIGDLHASFVLSGGIAYACKKDCLGVYPRNDDDEYWVQVSAEHIQVKQYTSPMWFPTFTSYGGSGGSVEPAVTGYDEQDELWVSGTSLNMNLYSRFWALEVFDVLSELLAKADPTITINEANYLTIVAERQPNLKHLSIYKRMSRNGYATRATNQKQSSTEDSCDGVYMETSLSEVVSLIKAMFNVDWYLTDDKEFRFIHPSQYCQDIPTPGDGLINNINTYLGKDFSSGLFIDTDQAAIGKEQFKIGGMSYNDGEFGVQEIIYNNNYAEIRENQYEGIEIDPMAVESVNESTVLCVATTEIGSYVNPLYRTVASEMIIPYQYRTQNTLLSTATLLQTYHLEGRPYAKGEYRAVVIDLVKSRTNEAQIEVPLINPFDVDFSKLLVTSYGNLMPISVEQNPITGVATIKGGK